MSNEKAVGRPKKSDKVRQEVLSNLREAMSIKSAYTLAGISERTYYRWIKEDEEWAEEVEMAKRFSEAVMVSRLKALGEEKADWRAYAWLLERRFPEEWTAKREIELNQTVNDGGAALVVQMIEQTDMRLLEMRDGQGENSADAQLEHTASTREDELQGEG
jgi:transposase